MLVYTRTILQANQKRHAYDNSPRSRTSHVRRQLDVSSTIGVVVTQNKKFRVVPKKKIPMVCRSRLIEIQDRLIVSGRGSVDLSG
jgi:hypothetical protein